MARTYFQVYFSYEEPLKSLSYEQIGKLFMAMFQYEKTKEKPELDPVSDMAFCFIRSQMERDQQAYVEITVEKLGRRWLSNGQSTDGE